jgi:hypothetical protein
MQVHVKLSMLASVSGPGFMFKFKIGTIVLLTSARPLFTIVIAS